MVSVIIPTRNRAGDLKKTLSSIFSQIKYPSKFEVIIIDNGSTDETKQVVKEFSDRNNYIKYKFENEPGLHIGRHAGLKIARYENLVFIDDDIEVEDRWLFSINEEFKKSDVAMIAGNVFPNYAHTPPAWIENLWEDTYFKKVKMVWPLSIIEFINSPKFVSPLNVFGCNFPIRKSILLEAGGFGPDAFPKEKIDFRGDGETRVSRFVQKKGKICVFNEACSVFHKVPANRMTKEYFYSRGFSEGISRSFSELRDKKSSRDSFLKILKSKIKFKITNHFLEHEAKDSLNILEKGISSGYRYHQEQYYLRKEIQEWVHRENFL